MAALFRGARLYSPFLTLPRQSADFGGARDEITAVFDKERERPARLHRAELSHHL